MERCMENFTYYLEKFVKIENYLLHSDFVCCIEKFCESSFQVVYIIAFDNRLKNRGPKEKIIENQEHIFIADPYTYMKKLIEVIKTSKSF